MEPWLPEWAVSAARSKLEWLVLQYVLVLGRTGWLLGIATAFAGNPSAPRIASSITSWAIFGSRHSTSLRLYGTVYAVGAMNGLRS